MPHRWSDILNAVAARTTRFRRVVVLAETDSTQDAVRRMGLRPGDVVTALRQTSGRGRLGRAWVDTEGSGVACTFVVDGQPAERLVAASAIATAEVAEEILGRRVSIKWPNDVYVDGRKLAGVLIERSADVALIGIGLNVMQEAFPDTLAMKATSLAILGIVIDRVDVLSDLLVRLSMNLDRDEHELAKEYDSRCMLRGRRVRLRTGHREVSGLVLRVSPILGLLIQTESGEEQVESTGATVLWHDGLVEGYHCADLDSA